MAWIDEALKKSGAEKYVLLELVLDDETLHFADRELREDDAYWEPWILDGCTIGRQLDPLTRRVSFQDVAITLKNPADAETGIGYWSGLLEGDTVLDGRAGTIYVAFKAADGTVYKQKVFSGTILPGDAKATEFDLSLHVPLEDRLGLLQRNASPVAFDEFLPAPVPMNVVLGTCTSASRGGPVKCIPLDLTSATKTFLVAQHAVASIGTVYRLKAGAWTTVSSGLTKVTSALDAEGHYYSKIEISSGHTDGDEYFADVTGLMTGGTVVLNGTSQYAYVNDHADFDITGDLTIEALLYRANASSYFLNKQDAANGYFWLFNAGKLRVYINGTNYIECSITVPALTWITIKTVYDASAAEISFYFDGIEVARGNNSTLSNCTRGGTIPTSITANNTRLTIGSQSTGVSPFGGRIAYVGIHAVESDNGNVIGPDGANCAGFWHFNGDWADASGNGHTLTPVGSPTFGTTWADPYKAVLCGNPAEALRELLLSAEGWNLADTELDHDAFDEAATYCADNGLAASGVFGGTIPESAGGLESEGQQWELLAQIARNFDHAVLPDREGRISLKRVPTELVSTSGLVHYRAELGDVVGPLIVIKQRPIAIINDARGLFKHAHSAEGGYDKYLRAYNETSQEFFGLKKEQQWPYRFHRDLETLKLVIGPHLQLRSGKTREVAMTTPGVWGLQEGSDVGDVVLLTAAPVFGTYQERQILITSSTANLLQGTVALKGLTLGDSVGAVAFSTEETAELVTSLTTFVGATQNPNPDSFQDAGANTSYGALSYLRIGHHYVIETPPGGLLPYYGNINWRTMLRWNLPASPWSGRTIKAVTIQLQVNSVPTLPYNVKFDGGGSPYIQYRGGFNGTTLCIYGDDTWDATETYNSANHDANVGASLGSISGGTGQKNVLLPTTGKNLFIAAAAGTGDGAGRDVNLCLGAFSNGDYTSAAILADTAVAVITFTT